MISTQHGSIFDSRTQVLVCPVNCVGVMGKGLALEFKRRFPWMHEEYRADCDKNFIVPGEVNWYLDFESMVCIACAATKLHWREASKHCWVSNCLREIADTISETGDTYAIPQLGCGCGGLDWKDVEPLYEKHLGGLDCDVEVWIYE